MAASEYCTIADLYSFGLSRGGLPNPARLVDEVSASDNSFALDEHGFVDGDELTFRADSIDGAMPGGLTENATYYALRVSDSVFRVSAAVSGSPVDLSSAGVRVMVAAPIPYASAIRWASEIVNDMLPAHVVPMVIVPEIVKMTTAELAVGKLMSRQGASAETLSAAVTGAQKRLERWAKGVPLRGPDAPARANLSASATVPRRDARGWLDDGTI